MKFQQKILQGLLAACIFTSIYAAPKAGHIGTGKPNAFDCVSYDNWSSPNYYILTNTCNQSYIYQVSIKTILHRDTYIL